MHGWYNLESGPLIYHFSSTYIARVKKSNSNIFQFFTTSIKDVTFTIFELQKRFLNQKWVEFCKKCNANDKSD